MIQKKTVAICLATVKLNLINPPKARHILQHYTHNKNVPNISIYYARHQVSAGYYTIKKKAHQTVEIEEEKKGMIMRLSPSIKRNQLGPILTQNITSDKSSRLNGI